MLLTRISELWKSRQSDLDELFPQQGKYIFLYPIFFNTCKWRKRRKEMKMRSITCVLNYFCSDLIQLLLDSKIHLLQYNYSVFFIHNINEIILDQWLSCMIGRLEITVYFQLLFLISKLIASISVCIGTFSRCIS